jgi:iron complex transport system ATP-binding protein
MLLPDGKERQPVLDMSGVSVRYRRESRYAVRGITVHASSGELITLLGANGAGKSTLLRVAAGVLPHESGHAYLSGRDLHTLPVRELSRSVAFVPQTEAVPSGFSVRDVVAMGRAPHQGAWMLEGEGDRTAVDDAIERCDLRTLSQRAVETLSGGEQRRVAVARALAQAPMLLLLDEPAAFLDVRHRLDLYELLQDVVMARGLACIVATHDLDGAARFSTRVLLMRDGEAIAHGAPDDVLSPEALRETFGVEVDSGLHAPSGERYFLPRRPTSPAAAIARAPRVR